VVGEKPNHGDPVGDERLICGSCGADHLARHFYGSDVPSQLRVRRERELVVITLQHLEWHAKHQAERAVEALQAASGSAQLIKSDDYFRYLQNWQNTPRKHINLLPANKRARFATKLRETIFCYSLLVVFAPLWAVIEVCERIKSVRESRPSERLRTEQENQDRLARFRARRSVRFDMIEANYRLVGTFPSPAARRAMKRTLYVGYELDNASPDNLPSVQSPYEEALGKLNCAECGELGTLTDGFLPGMICPCCKSDTLEESPEVRAQRGTLWL
jgi:hypothetical protein